ncbi:MAG: hypothetical protein HY392_01890 [Candidatus Diapherotrites archaeon]|nr:hypothetical protein [Candidatus Diapherotrites archaeon]
MFELTDKRLLALLWILENKGKDWSILELQKKSVSLGYGPLYNFVKELEKNGFVSLDSKTHEYRVSKAIDIIRFISLARPFRSLNAIPYYSSLDFIGNLKMVNGAKLPYAFTVFAGSELYHSYVKTDQVHMYVKEGDEKKWEKYLLSKNCLKAQKSQANIFLIPTKQQIFFTKPERIKGFSIVPTPVLLSDLFSFGGLAEEQANFLIEQWLENRL